LILLIKTHVISFNLKRFCQKVSAFNYITSYIFGGYGYFTFLPHFQHPISNSRSEAKTGFSMPKAMTERNGNEYPISKKGHCRGQVKTLFLLCYLGRCPRLLYWGLSALKSFVIRSLVLWILVLSQNEWVVCFHSTPSMLRFSSYAGRSQGRVV